MGNAITFPSEIVDIPVYIENMANISSFQGTISYGSDLEFLSASSSSFSITTNNIDSENTVYIGFTFSPISFTIETEVLQLRFRVKSTAQVGFIPIEFTDNPIPTEFFDDSFNPISFSIENGGIDINGILSSSTNIQFKIESKSNSIAISMLKDKYLNKTSPSLELANQEGIFEVFEENFTETDSSYIWTFVKNNLFFYARIRVGEQISQVQELPIPLTTSLIVYPNPTSSKFFISGKTDDIQSTRIINTTGKTIYHSVSVFNSLDLSNFQNGLYILLISKFDGSTQSYKILKN
jgi:hypothetical protein